jgi:hypothetical protein
MMISSGNLLIHARDCTNTVVHFLWDVGKTYFKDYQHSRNTVYYYYYYYYYLQKFPITTLLKLIRELIVPKSKIITKLI